MRKLTKLSLLSSGVLFVIAGAFPQFVSAQSGEAVTAEALISEQKSDFEKKLAAERAEVEASIADSKLENENEEVLGKKLELAKRIHEIRPTRDQVDSAIERAAMGLPDMQRDAFKASMRGALNYNAIEKISIDAMIETFTLKELMSMVEYYEKPEATSASMKLGVWAGQVQPEIVRMIDRAIMRARIGQ